jgi:hypothetical protein
VISAAAKRLRRRRVVQGLLWWKPACVRQRPFPAVSFQQELLLRRLDTALEALSASRADAVLRGLGALSRPADEAAGGAGVR